LKEDNFMKIIKIIKVCKDFKERLETRAEGKAFRENFLND